MPSRRWLRGMSGTARGVFSLLASVAACALASRAHAAGNPLQQQFDLASASAIKIVVRGEGWMRVTQPELIAAGLDAGVDPANLRLFADGVEQAIAVRGNGDSTFAADEAIEFYGVGRDTLWTDARTYWLVTGSAGVRVVSLAPAPGGASAPSFAHTERLMERKNYVAAIKNGDETNFFGAVVSPSASPIQTISVHHLDAALAGQSTLRVNLQGVTKTAHQVNVSLNGNAAGTCAFDEQAAGSCSFSASGVMEGDNQIALVATASASDVSVVKSVEIAYAHTYTADDDALALMAPAAATQLTIAGFASSNIRVVDVTDPSRPVELAVTVSAQGATSSARIDTPAGTEQRALYAFSDLRLGKPASVALDQPSTWSQSHDGDFVILSHAQFLDALAPLVTRRAAEGWAVQLVDLQDVYDEFGGGDKTVVAIRDFLQYARTEWRVPPRFVLLVGDATFDPRNFLGKGDFDFAPTRLIDTQEMETVSDDWFVDTDLDGVPEIAIGRFPVRTKEEAATVVQKTLIYPGTADRPRGGLFVTDTNGTDLDFEAASAAAEAKVSDIMPVDRFQRGQAGAVPATLLQKLNDGPFLVNYLGHGSVEVWDGVFSSAQAKALTNSHTSVYVIMNCLNGFFHDLYTESLAEALLKAPQGGAVAVWASSTLAEFAPQPAFNQEFLMRFSRTSLGETAIAAKQAITDVEARRTWVLFGDPTLFGKPLDRPDGGTTNGDAGMMDAGMMDAEMMDAGMDAGMMDAGTADTGGMAVDGAATPDGGSAPPVDATSPDAIVDGVGDASGVDAGGSSRPTDGGCGCRFDPASPATPGASALLLLASLVARRPRPRRPRRPGRRWLGLLTLALTWLVWTPGAEAAYSYRKSMTIDRTRIGNTGAPTTLANYPLLVSVTDTALKTVANGGHVQNTNGYDITFVAADTTTCGGPSSCTLNYEIETYVATTGQVVAWVQVPALKTVSSSSNTVIYVKYGDATISSPTASVNATWSANFKGVWHLQQDPGGTAPQMTDSTSTAANATATNGPATATGEIGTGVSADGTNDYFDYTTSASFNWTSSDTFTYSGWFKTSDTSGPLLSQRGSVAGNPVIDIMVGYDGATTNAGKLMALVRDDNNGAGYAEVIGTTSVSDNAWHYFTMTRSAGTITLYLDGTSQGSNTGAGAAAAITTNLRNIGREGNWVLSGYATAGDQYLAATLDEYRISNTVRSGDWITTDYNTQFSPASTFTWGSETLASCGDGAIIAGEACDDGNFVSGDGCSSACVVEAGFSCSGMPSSCTTTCSDSIVAGSEGCDDGNLTNGDGCSSSCTVEAAYHCSGSPSSCVLATFDYLKTITIDRTKVGTASSPATLTDYPILFSVTDSSLRTIANGGRMRNANAYDMVFRALDATTCGGPTVCTLAHEIEKYDATTGQLIAWVKVPGLKSQTSAANTTFNILFGNRAISTTTEQKTSVWNSGFKAVWHLHQNPSGTAPQMTDSTSNANDGTATSLTTATGEVGSGVSLDGTASFMAFNSGTSLQSASMAAFTYSGWVKTSDTFGGIFSSRSSTDGGNLVIDVMVGMDGASSNSGKLMTLVRDDTSGAYAEVVGATVNDNTWHYVTITRSGSTVQLYLDTTSQGTASGAGSGGALTSNLRAIGRESRWVQDAYTTNANEYLSGTLDEFRASNTVRSIDWITTDYNNQSSPSTFVTYTTGSGGEVATTSTTDVMLVSFDATETCQGTTLRWQTTYEVDTLGFNVFREAAGHRVQLNPALIYGMGIAGTGSNRYELVDSGPIDVARTYWLQDVSFALDSVWYGPISPAAGLACTPAPRPTPAPTVVGAGAGPAETPVSGAAGDEAGGCSLGGDRGGALGACLALLALVGVARRRRAPRA